MTVILSALLFLFGAPAVLLWMGKLIYRLGQPRPARAVSRAGEAWYYRPVQPIFGQDAQTAELAAAPAQADDPWYRRSSTPMFTRPSWLRRPIFAGHRTD